VILAYLRLCLLRMRRRRTAYLFVVSPLVSCFALAHLLLDREDPMVPQAGAPGWASLQASLRADPAPLLFVTNALGMLGAFAIVNVVAWLMEEERRKGRLGHLRTAGFSAPRATTSVFALCVAWGLASGLAAALPGTFVGLLVGLSPAAHGVILAGALATALRITAHGILAAMAGLELPLAMAAALTNTLLLGHLACVITIPKGAMSAGEAGALVGLVVTLFAGLMFEMPRRLASR
jgi:hypothetical protein